MRTIGIGDKLRFTCVRCEICCGTGPNVSVTVFDIIRLSKRLNIHPREVLYGLMNVVIADMFPFVSLGGDAWGRCVFLGFNENGETYCRVYDSRPFKCVIYPAKAKDLGGTFDIDAKCPGLDIGEEIELLSEDAHLGLEELKEHYRILHKLIIEENLPPMEALLVAINEIYRRFKEKG